MSSGVCSHCKGSDIDYDPARGNSVCTNCGSVLEDQIIVSEVQFQENALGGASVIGQYVSGEGGKSHNMGNGFHHGFGKESRAITLSNGKKKITQLGAQLKLNTHCIDTAYNFFKMAVTKRLTRGRKTSHVVAACLYLVCRTEGTPHMLLDFSDVLQINVYSLGRTYLQLSRELCLNIPALDPCLYIHRFAHKLEFEEKTHEVSMTALRLLSRMKRDWMAQGRRPSGLCGAALLVAARIHDFNRTIKEIIKVVKIGEGTIRKRLTEFEQTPSSQLTIEEFQKIDLEEEMDPPCFTEGRRKAKLAQLEEQGQLPELQSEITHLQQEIEEALDDAVTKKKKNDDASSVCSSAPSVSDLEDDLAEIAKCAKFIEEETFKAVVSSDLSENAEKSPGENPTDSDIEKDTVDSRLMPPPGLDEEKNSLLTSRPTAASLGLKETIEECMKVPEEGSDEEESGELDITGLDEEEINHYILSPTEVRTKTRIWIQLNLDYLKEEREKALKEAKLREMGVTKPEKKQKRKNKKKSNKEASTAGEALEKMLQERKISSKINYDVLKDLNKISDVKTESKKTEPVLPLLGAGSVEITPVDLKSSRFKRSHTAAEVKSQDIFGGEGPPDKKPKIEDIKPKVEDVIVESGPVNFAAEEECEDDYYEEEEDEEHVSAAKLMGHNVEEDYYEIDDMD